MDIFGKAADGHERLATRCRIRYTLSAMEVWFAQHSFDLAGQFVATATLLFAAHTFHKDEKARRISNLLAIQQEYSDIWHAQYDRPELARVVEPGADLKRHPVTAQEELFVRTLIFHLDNVRRAVQTNVLVSLPGVRKDVREFFTLPIPRAVWETHKDFQSDELTAFVESCLSTGTASVGIAA